MAAEVGPVAIDPQFENADFSRGAETILQDVLKRLEELLDEDRSILKVQFLGIVDGAKMRALEEEDDEMYTDGVLYFYKEIYDNCEFYPANMDDEEFAEFRRWLREQREEMEEIGH